MSLTAEQMAVCWQKLKQDTETLGDGRMLKYMNKLEEDVADNTPRSSNSTVLEYVIPLNPDTKRLEKYNKEYGTDYKSTVEHVNILIDKIYDAIEQVGNEGGWYIGDTIRAKVQLHYEPEDK